MRKIGLGTSCLVAILCGMSSGVYAQTTGVEVVTVTAFKREQSIQDVPATVSALSGDDMRNLGFQNLQDIATKVPDLEYQNNGLVSRFSLRGINLNSIDASSESPILINIDGVPQGSASNFNTALFDLNRVEVLAGPQGTLYGRNSNGGTVNLISKRPTSVLDGYASVQYGNYGKVVAEGAISGPITNSVRARLSIKSDNDDGLQTSLNTGAKWWTTHLFAARGQLDFDLNDHADLLINAHYSNQHGISPGYGLGGTRVPGNLTQTCATALVLAGSCVSSVGEQGTNRSDLILGGLAGTPPPPYRKQEFGSNADLTWKLGDDLTLHSLTGWENITSYQMEDGPGSFLSERRNQSLNNFHQASEELRLDGTNGDLKWVAGAFYFWSIADVESLGQVVPNAPFDLGTFKVGSDSYAAFADGTYAITDKLNLSLGGRFTNEFKTNNGVDIAGVTVASLSPKIPVPVYFKTKNDVFTWRAAVDYHFDDRLMAYASISTGFKAPGFQTQFVQSTDPTSFAPSGVETVTTYELGAKTSWFDNSLVINPSLFYSDYKGLQQILTVPSLNGFNTAKLLNVQKAEIYGVETTVEYVANQYFDVTASGSYLQSHIIDATYQGNRVTGAPEGKFSISPAVHYPLEDNGLVTLLASYRWQDKEFFSLDNNPLKVSQPYGVVDLRAMLVPPGHPAYSLEAFASNLTNENYVTYAATSPATGGGRIIVWGAPRIFGVRATVNIGQ